MVKEEDRSEKPEQKSKRKERRKHWSCMNREERSWEIAAAFAHSAELWNQFSSQQRVGLSDKVAKLKLDEMDAKGFGEIKRALLERSNGEGIRLLFHPPASLREEKKQTGSRPWRKGR